MTSKTSSDAINAVVELLLKILEAKLGGVDTPIVQTSVAAGSVKFRIATVNPSKTKKQFVQIKNYLPSEVKPKDIMELGGLELDYDPEKGIYYVYKNAVELKPSEARVFEVEVEDIWFVSEAALGDVRDRVISIVDRSKGTGYYDKILEIANTVYPRLDEIIATQNDESVSRQQHIGIYRQNMSAMDAIREDIARMEKILATAGGPLAPEMLTKTKIKAELPSKTMTWIVIFVIIVFTGLLAAVLFFTWQRQASITKEAILESKKAAFPDLGKKEGEAQAPPPSEEKKE